MGVAMGMGFGLGVGLAACPALISQDIFIHHIPDAVDAARQAVASIPTPRIGNPFVAHAWEVKPALGSSENGRCPLGFEIITDPTSYKAYHTVRLPSIQSTFMPWNIIKTYLKNLGLVALINTNIWVWEALEAEERAIQQNLPPEAVKAPSFPELDPMIRKAVWNSWRELLTTCVRRIYEHAVAAHTSARTAWKTLKDWRASITRKATWYEHYRAHQFIPMYTRTISRCTFLLYAADWTVSCLYELVDAIKAIQKHHVPFEKAATVFLGHAARNTLRCTASWTISAVGAAVIASMFSDGRAGRAAVISHFLLDALVNQGVVLLMDGGFGQLMELMGGGKGDKQQQQQQQQSRGWGIEGLGGAGSGWDPMWGAGPGGGAGAS